RGEPAFGGERAVPVRDLVEDRPLLAHIAQPLRTVLFHPGTEEAAEFLVSQRIPVRRRPGRHHGASRNTGSRFSRNARIASFESSCCVISTVRFCSKR